MNALFLSFLAGLLTTLSPCVLPLLPLILAGAAARSRFGPLVLIGSLVLTSAALGLGLATLARGASFDPEIIRKIGAALLALMGLVLLVPALQTPLSRIMAPLSGWASRMATRADGHGLAGQAAVGALTGLIWSPCAGPTLGAAIGLVVQARTFALGATEMLIFSVGAATPMLLLAYGARAGVARRRGWLTRFARPFKTAAALGFLAIGLLTLTGMDRRLEALLVQVSPAWLTDFSTRL